MKDSFSDSFSKNVMLLQANQNDEQKMLYAVLLSQYRKLIAIKNNIVHFKPIILFKSNKIETSKIKQIEFEQLIANLTADKVETWLSEKQSALIDKTKISIWQKVVRFYEKQDLIQLVAGIQSDFQTLNLFNANTSDLLESNPRLLNTLEEPDNPIRAIFAVAKLNERWDVLNLYDIVRISENASITANSTNSEAQLIGRGARYYPFNYGNTLAEKRRFDGVNEEIAILETLHYHTINETSYIKALHQSLTNADITVYQDNEQQLMTAKVKDNFKKMPVYQNGCLYINKIVEIKDEARNWETYSIEKVVEKNYRSNKEENINTNQLKGDAEKLFTHTLNLDVAYYRKAIQRLVFYSFDNLKKYFPNLKSIHEFITSKEYLAGIKINVNLPNMLTLDNLIPKEKLSILEEVLNDLSNNLCKNYKKNKGTKEFYPVLIKDVIRDYEFLLPSTPIQTSSSEVLQHITVESMIGSKWYVFDNALLNQLEHRLVRWIKVSLMDNLKNSYTDIFLLRNNEKNNCLKLVEFNGVRGFMPDFILILKHKETGNFYQILLEPKGENRIHDDAWKQKMLLDIYPENIEFSDDKSNACIYGIKFYTDTNKSLKQDFIKDIELKLFGRDSKILSDLSEEIQGSLF